MKKLDDILKRCEAATPGPWEAVEDGIRCFNSSRRDPNWKDWIGLKISEHPLVGQKEANTEFIAHARTDLPLVVAALKKAVGVLEDYSGPNKMSETRDTLLNRFERWRKDARVTLAEIETLLGENK